MNIRVSLLGAILLASNCSLAQTMAFGFDGVTKWQETLTPSSIGSIKGLYSANPPAMYMAKGQHQPSPDISPETDFWQKLVASGATEFKTATVEEQDRQGLHLVTLAVSMKMKTPSGLRTRYVTEDQAWQQQTDGWRIVIAKHSDVVKMPPALHPNPNLYDANADAKAEIREAESRAKKNNQHIVLVFGANWCYDCHVLDQAFHQADVAPLLEKSFQVVHVDIGDDGKKNNDVAEEYGVPLAKGIPALAVLNANGKLLYSQKSGEWESARSLDPDEIVKFLHQWKP